MKMNIKQIILVLIVILLLLIVPCFIVKDLTFLSELQLNAIYVYFTFLIMLVALFGKEFWNWYQRPEITLEFNEENPFIVDAGSIVWIRVRMYNKGHTTAKKCEARLEKIFDATSQVCEIKDHFDKLILPWVGYPYAVKGDKRTPEISYIASKEWITMDIAEDMDALFDICYIIKNTKEICLVTSVEWPLLVEWKRKEQKLNLFISVYGDNFKPRSRKIEIDVESILKQAKGASALV